MKKILFVLLMLIAARVSGQCEFSPIGAEWHYNYNNFSTRGYVNVKSESDTVIDGVSCKKLVKSINVYDFMTDKVNKGVFGYEYMAQINDSVMIYVDGVFKKLYDFSAEIGDTIIIPALEHHEEYTHGTAVVTGKGVMEFEGDSLKYIDLKQPEDWEDSPWKFSCYHDYSNDYYNTVRICEKIGNISGYLLPEKYFIADDEEGGALRCYSDEELNVKFSDEDCDFIYEPRLYQSFFGNDSTTVNLYTVITDGDWNSTFTIRNKDTITINDNSYYFVEPRHVEYEYGYKTYWYTDETIYFREEQENGRLYLYIKNDNLEKELLLCDMSLNIGDTFTLPSFNYYLQHEIVVENVRYEGGKKIIEFGDFWEGDLVIDNLMFIEGVFPMVMSDFYDATFSELICQHKDDEFLYENPELALKHQNCLMETYLSTEEIKVGNLMITPTIFSNSDMISINTNSEIKEVKMIDMLGREINISINLTEDFTSQISLNQRCNSGIYLIIVETEKDVYYEKVVLRD